MENLRRTAVDCRSEFRSIRPERLVSRPRPPTGYQTNDRNRRKGVNGEADRERPLPSPSEPFRSLTERSTALAQSHQFEHMLGMSARPHRTALLDADPPFWDVPTPDIYSRRFAKT